MSPRTRSTRAPTGAACSTTGSPPWPTPSPRLPRPTWICWNRWSWGRPPSSCCCPATRRPAGPSTAPATPQCSRGLQPARSPVGDDGSAGDKPCPTPRKRGGHPDHRPGGRAQGPALHHLHTFQPLHIVLTYHPGHHQPDGEAVVVGEGDPLHVGGQHGPRPLVALGRHVHLVSGGA